MAKSTGYYPAYYALCECVFRPRLSSHRPHKRFVHLLIPIEMFSSAKTGQPSSAGTSWSSRSRPWTGRPWSTRQRRRRSSGSVQAPRVSWSRMLTECPRLPSSVARARAWNSGIPWMDQLNWSLLNCPLKTDPSTVWWTPMSSRSTVAPSSSSTPATRCPTTWVSGVTRLPETSGREFSCFLSHAQATRSCQLPEWRAR